MIKLEYVNVPDEIVLHDLSPIMDESSFSMNEKAIKEV